MGIVITEQQSELINNALPTHDYSLHSDLYSGSNICKYYTGLFEYQTNILQNSISHDIGGVIVYMNGFDLAAFFDYENFYGTVFD